MSKLKEMENEKQTLLQQVNTLIQERNATEQKCLAMVKVTRASHFYCINPLSLQHRDNGQLSQLVSDQAMKIDSLESKIDQSSSQYVNTDQLLESMQSDKVAAARALSQNKQLKEQLEELQNGFIMMVKIPFSLRKLLIHFMFYFRVIRNWNLLKN